MSQHTNGVIGSLIYKFSERVLVKLIAFVISIILARLIEPGIFGLLAIITVFTNLCQVFVQSGMNVALVQNKDTREEDYSTVFWFSLAIAGFLYIGLFFVAPLIARYYENDVLIAPLRVLALCLVAGTFNMIQGAKLSREMQFQKQMICTLIATVVSGIVGVWMAYAGYGLWALVAYQLFNQVAVSLAMLAVAHWIPRFTFSLERAKVFFSYGWKILISNLLFSLYTDIRSLVIGKVYTTEDLALYDRANQMPNIVSYNLEIAMQAVMLPALSKKQNDIAAVREDLSRMIRYTTYLIAPIMAGIAAVATPFVLFFLKEKWADCIPYMMIFCIGYAFLPVSGACNVSIKAIGRSDTFAKNQAIRIGTMFVILLLTLVVFRSVFAIVIGYTISQFLEMLIALWPAKQHIGYTYLNAAKDILPNFAISLLMGGAVYLIVTLIPSHPIALAVGIPAGIILYLLLSILTKNKAFYMFLSLAKKVLNRKKQAP